MFANTFPAPESDADLLNAVDAWFARFVAYPSDAARHAHVLWVAHCWGMSYWENTPRIAFLSPEPGSGKSRALEVTEPLVPRPIHAVNTTPAYLFRKVSDEAGAPTILYDEIDTVFGPKVRDGNEDIRGLLNAGHRQGAMAGRCVTRGKVVETEELPAYCAVALAGLNDLPDTISSRSVIVRMRRRAPSERVQPYRRRVSFGEGEALGKRLAEWIGAHRELADAWPELPNSVEDRDADVWEPLFAVADLAGDHWPDTARRAAVALIAASRDDRPSLNVQLLADLRIVFADEDKLSTEDILERLQQLDESPWSDLHGKPLDARGLAGRLRRYDVKSKNVRMSDGKIPKGYEAVDLADAWARYLPPPKDASSDSSASCQQSATSATPLHPGATGPDPVADDPVGVADTQADVADDNPPIHAQRSAVADVADYREDEQAATAAVCQTCGKSIPIGDRCAGCMRADLDMQAS